MEGEGISSIHLFTPKMLLQPGLGHAASGRQELHLDSWVQGPALFGPFSVVLPGTVAGS